MADTDASLGPILDPRKQAASLHESFSRPQSQIASKDSPLEWYPLSREQISDQNLPATTAFMLVRNTGNTPLIFKVKTTSPKVFRVQPKDGSVKPNSTQEIHISLIENPKTSRFRLVYMSDFPEQDLKDTSISDYIMHVEKKIEQTKKPSMPYVAFQYSLDPQGNAVLTASPVSKPRHKESHEDSILSSMIENTAVATPSSISATPAKSQPAGPVESENPPAEALSSEIRQRNIPTVQLPQSEPVTGRATDTHSTATDSKAALAFAPVVDNQVNTQVVPFHLTAILCLVCFLLGYIL